MIENHITTSFGRRTISLAYFKLQSQVRNLEEGKVADKWQVYRWLCEAKKAFGVGDRSLAVLSALLSFIPDNTLSDEIGLIVFPSNAQLSLRAHGMACATLRRHLAALVDCGLILRKDSPNGKRYSRKGKGGEITEAFGFSLAPLLARAEELQKAADNARAEKMALKLVRERITLHRRDTAKLIETAVIERIPGNWQALWQRLRSIVDAIPRQTVLTLLEPILNDLEALHEEVAILLEKQLNAENMSGNESQTDAHQQNTKQESYIESESRVRHITNRKSVDSAEITVQTANQFSLELVVKACPDIADYATGNIQTWRELAIAASHVKQYLGISPSSYHEAIHILGEKNAAIVIACILQRIGLINSAGAYLHSLTIKARTGHFSVGPMLMAALRAQSTRLYPAKPQ